VFLEVRGGPIAFRRAVLSPGDRVRVGRTSLSDFAIADDEQLSQIHWQLSWDGTTCEARDMDGAGGILVGGEQKERAILHRSGAWIRAGRTDFSVFFEDVGEAVPTALGAGRAQEIESAFAFLREVAERGALFAVLDAARTERIVPLLHTAADEFDSLYQGIQAQTMADGAPYLVRFAKESRLLRRLVFEGWGQSWGSYLESRAPLRELRSHFRRLLMVTRESNGQPMYFRFYDPRVLRTFLPTCALRQKEQIFGEVEAFLVAGRDSELVRFAAHEAPAVLTSPQAPMSAGLELDA
jgi:Domain of unknown function (DUF4123)